MLALSHILLLAAIRESWRCLPSGVEVTFAYAKIALATVPCTSVRRKSRPA
jgi:hypothetical protein